MEIGRIADLLRPFAELTRDQLTSTSTYIDLLVKWNARVSLTAIRDPDEIVTRHFGESYFAAKILLLEDWVGSVIDFGSGAGFPGIPLAMFRPKATVTLIESNGKKAAFLNEVVGQLGLRNIELFRGRGESCGRKADLVVMRAVESFDRALDVAAGLIQPGGHLALLIGERQMAAAKRLEPHLSWSEPVRIPQGHKRILLVGKL
jgi:16S rRNA (guanine527-N7)-methyltransferase